MDIYLIIVVVLLLLAVLDLTVGVANDAVNFLNSAIGSKAAPFKLIILVAALGVMAGVTFSSGMMEIARKGIFNPEYFLMPELLFIFLGVMFQDILLMDFFNTFGLPTSTTVSIVFGLFGAAVAMAIIKISNTGDSFSTIGDYINSQSVLMIITAILLSIIIAFLVGSFVQYVTRTLFTFDFKERFRKYGSIWSGLALTALSLFIVMKGAKGASFIPADAAAWMKNNVSLLSLYLFIGWTIILQLIMWFTKLDVLKGIVLFGTFALAMAFAANDLVNFIGAPLAGLNAYTIAMQTPNPLTTSMDVLRNPIEAQTWVLLIAGLIMMVTLFMSRKAQTVARTAINLGRHGDVVEKFESNALAREIVRMVIWLVEKVEVILPARLKRWIAQRNDITKYKPEIAEDGEAPAFDTLRASVILMVSAALISFATTLKLPLSTTYVTFIVAMAAALPDQAWGRESAVYRVSGVITVISGWFFTAITAAIAAGIIATIMYYLELYGVAAFLILVGYSLYRTTTYNIKQSKKDKLAIEKLIKKTKKTKAELTNDELNNISDYILSIIKAITDSNKALAEYDLNALKKANRLSKDNILRAGHIRGDILNISKNISDEEIEGSNSFTRALASFGEVAGRAQNLTAENLRYINNNHKPITKDQRKDLEELNSMVEKFTAKTTQLIYSKQFDEFDTLAADFEEIEKQIDKFSKNQMKRYKHAGTQVRRSMMFLNIMYETSAVLLNLVKLARVAKDISEQMAIQTAKKLPDVHSLEGRI